MGRPWQELDELRKQEKSLSKELDEIKSSKAIFGEILDDADEALEVWESLRASLEEGQTVFAPEDKSSKKRKANGSQKMRKNKRQFAYASGEDENDWDYEESDSSDIDQDDVSEVTSAKLPLTEEQINAKIVELRATRKEARTQRSEMTEKVVEMRKRIGEASEEAQKIEAEMSALCISGRNKYSRDAIQQVRSYLGFNQVIPT